MSEKCSSGNASEGMSEVERSRAKNANRIYCGMCEKNGIKICSWENSSAWRDYVDGSIGESELVQRADEEMKEIQRVFSKYTVVGEKDLDSAEQDAERAQRIKTANKIYRKACTDSGQNRCFFKNFNTWSAYVQGRITEVEFYEQALSEVEKMASAGK